MHGTCAQEALLTNILGCLWLCRNSIWFFCLGINKMQKYHCCEGKGTDNMIFRFGLPF
jgi:hypothetical protein